jgi:hypothetical protein
LFRRREPDETRVLGEAGRAVERFGRAATGYVRREPARLAGPPGAG